MHQAVSKRALRSGNFFLSRNSRQQPCIRSTQKGTMIVRWKTNNTKSAISKTLKAQENQVVGKEHLFGLKPVDITILPPLHRTPPPPPPKKGVQKYLSPMMILTTAGFIAYFYYYNKNDNYQYWEAMQTGGVLPGTYDDEDDDDDDEE